MRGAGQRALEAALDRVKDEYVGTETDHIAEIVPTRAPKRDLIVRMRPPVNQAGNAPHDNLNERGAPGEAQSRGGSWRLVMVTQPSEVTLNCSTDRLFRSALALERALSARYASGTSKLRRSLLTPARSLTDVTKTGRAAVVTAATTESGGDKRRSVVCRKLEVTSDTLTRAEQSIVIQRPQSASVQDLRPSVMAVEPARAERVPNQQTVSFVGLCNACRITLHS
jgi:hypothetical protein